MPEPTKRLLLLEDDRDVAETVQSALIGSGMGFELIRVDAGGDFRGQLCDYKPDVIVADYALANLAKPEAIAVWLAELPDVPFIYISASGGEERVVEAIKGGAADFVSTSRLDRLAPAIETALLEIGQRSRRHREAETLRVYHERYEYFVNQTTEGFYRLDFVPSISTNLPHEEQVEKMYESGNIGECNQVFAETYGFANPEAMVGSRLVDLHGGSDIPENLKALNLFIRNGYRHLAVETVETGIDGDLVYLSNNSVGIVEDGMYVSCWGTQRDITEQRLAENKVNESRAQLRALLERLQRAQEDERVSVSREIHDELGQSLTGLKMDLSWLERKLSEPERSGGLNPLLERAVAASELVDSTIERVQKLAAELRPVALDQLGLGAALTVLARRFQKQLEVPCTLEVVEPIPKIPPEIANELFYICQEALTNVARHADASMIQIRVRMEGFEILLEVIDDGNGIDEGRIGVTSSLGLLGMRERALKFGGVIDVRNMEPSGTRVLVRIPFVPASGAKERGGKR